MHFRLRWYAVSTARLLLRRWQGIVLAVGILAAANAPGSNLRAIAYPLLLALEPGHSALWHLLHLLLLQALAALWVFAQREQIGGGAFMQFAGSLPFTRGQRRMVDAAVLVLADTPLLLMLVSALSVCASGGAKLVDLLLLADVALLALVGQLCVLERRFAGFGAVAAACGLLAFGRGTALAMALDVAAGTLACTLLCVWLPRTGLWLHQARALMPGARADTAPDAPARRAPPMTAGVPPALLISLSVLLRQRRAEALSKALVAGCVAAAALGLMMIFEYDGRAALVAMLAQGWVALSVSGLYRSLHSAHCASARYFGALPLGKGWWRWSDALTVITFGLPFAALLGGAVCWQGAASWRQGALGLVSFALLLGVLRGPQLFNERHAVVLSTCLSAAWIAASFGLLY